MKIEELAKKHRYHCDHYASDALQEYATWNAFFDEMGDADEDYNLLFRWDIKKNDNGSHSMFLYFMQQRRGRFVPFIIDSVTDDDVQSIYDYLLKKWHYIADLWAPIFALDVMGVE